MGFGRTRNRSLLGTLNDYEFMARSGDTRRTEPESPEELMRFLSQTPIHGCCFVDYAADYTDDPDIADLPPEVRANPSMAASADAD